MVISVSILGTLSCPHSPPPLHHQVGHGTGTEWQAAGDRLDITMLENMWRLFCSPDPKTIQQKSTPTPTQTKSSIEDQTRAESLPVPMLTTPLPPSLGEPMVTASTTCGEGSVTWEGVRVRGPAPALSPSICRVVAQPQALLPSRPMEGPHALRACGRPSHSLRGASDGPGQFNSAAVR